MYAVIFVDCSAWGEAILAAGRKDVKTCFAYGVAAHVLIALRDIGAADALADFADIFCYETAFMWHHGGSAVLDRVGMYETAEVWVNWEHGVRFAPPCRFDIGGLLRPGPSALHTEVATLLGRAQMDFFSRYSPQEASGLPGPVPNSLLTYSEEGTMSSWQTGYVEVDGLRLHYTRTGGAKPPLVLAHGFSDHGLCWSPIARALEADYDVIMVDARGHGRSDDPEQEYGSVAMARDLAGVIAALGLEKPAILGHSMGAATTIALASMFPDVPGKILLEDPPAWWMPMPADPVARDAWLANTRRWIVRVKRLSIDEMIAVERANNPGWSDEELEPWADSKMRLSFNVLNRSDDEAFDWALLAQISCPTLLITADHSRGAIVTPEGAQEFQVRVPHAQVAHIAEAGHSIRRDQLSAYLEVVRAFLRDN